MKPKPLPAVLVTALPFLLLASCKSGKPSDDARGKGRTSRYAAVVVAPEPFLDQRGGMATVSVDEQVDLRIEASGRVAQILFREGGPVRKGSVLLRLDDTEAGAQRDRAAAKARLASATVSRMREQIKVEAASSQQLEVSLADSAVAAADLALAEVALEKTRIRAPFDGVAGLLDVSRGQWVQAGQKMTTLVSRSGARLEWAVSEGDAFGLKLGARIPWREPASGREGIAEVSALDPALDESTRTRALRAVCRTGCDRLLPGMAVEVRLPMDSTPVLTVPSQTLSGNAKGVALYLHRAGNAVQVGVIPGRRSDTKVEILSGISAGDTVLLPGASPPKPGSPVEIARILGGKHP